MSVKHALLSALVSIVSLPATALAGGYGGGGITFSDATLNDGRFTWIGDSAISAPGDISCFGGGGFGVSASRHRHGGEGQFCGGDGFAMAYGGYIEGVDLDVGPVYLTAYTSSGVGWMGLDIPADQQEGWDSLNHVFLYARPTAAVGIPLRWVSLEWGVYAFGSISLFQQAKGGPLWSFPHLGSQLSVMFGDYSRRRSYDDRGDEEWEEDCDFSCRW
jgi:hypothetical protein